jgi:hypothetical protein
MSTHTADAEAAQALSSEIGDMRGGKPFVRSEAFQPLELLTCVTRLEARVVGTLPRLALHCRRSTTTLELR